MTGIVASCILIFLIMLLVTLTVFKPDPGPFHWGCWVAVLVYMLVMPSFIIHAGCQ